MTGRRLLWTMAGAALLAAGLGDAGAAQAATDLTVCNDTGSKVFVAIVHFREDTKVWILSAWHTADPGQCRSVGRYRTGLTYYFAEKEGRAFHWPAKTLVDRTYCVPNAKVERTLVSGATCATGERAVGFQGFTPRAATHTIRLAS